MAIDVLIVYSKCMNKCYACKAIICKEEEYKVYCDQCVLCFKGAKDTRNSSVRKLDAYYGRSCEQKLLRAVFYGHSGLDMKVREEKKDVS